jgi:cytochrome c peroxidase
LFIEGVAGIAEIGCAHCHLLPTFGMRNAGNNGLDVVYRDKGLGGRDVPSNNPFTPSNDGKFKASPLRNVALTAPYMHDGRFKTLEEVVNHYSSGVHPHPNLCLAFDAKDRAKGKGTSGFRYSAKQKAAIIAFLKTLTDEKFVSDPIFSDPFIRQDN